MHILLVDDHTLFREALLQGFVPARCIRQVMDDIVTSISRQRQKARPGRSYARKSMKPESKWRGCKCTLEIGRITQPL